MPTPFDKIHIEITNVCNLKCPFCPVSHPSPHDRSAYMSAELFRTIIQQAAPLTRQVCLHLLGEPLIHPELREILDLCSKHHAPVYFVTNGVLLREKQTDLLLHPAIRQINFSLHSWIANHGTSEASPYLERILQFTQLALQTRPDLFVNFRLWNLSEPQGRESKNVDMLKRLEKEFQIQIPQNMDVRTEKSIRLDRHLFLHFDTEFVWPSLSEPILHPDARGYCHALSSHFGILADGTVVPCCLDHRGTIELGKIPDQSLAEILASPRAEKMKQGFRDRKLIEPLCQRCQFIERFN